MSKLFISYRRDDTADICGRLYDKLAPRFGADNVFKDVDSIPLGADFRQVLHDSVAQCAAMLVIIGRNWLTATDQAGRRRLESPNDFVRIEVEAALARNIPVIPVLVQGATMPQEHELPTSLVPLAYRHGTDVRGDPHFHRDADQLLDRLAPLLQVVPAQPTAPVAPAPPAQPPEQLPTRLASLGFTANQKNGVAYILPPLCAVSAGEFLMGSDKRKDSLANDSELPQHRVTLGAYQIGAYPVTVAEYACAVRANAVREPPKGVLGMDWQTQLRRLDHPVVCVSWQDALAYVRWLAQMTGQPWRLPSEAEWEKAARGNDGRLYPWGDQWDKARANTADGGPKTTTPVGAYADRGDASPCGVHDLAGNVWEWTSSLFTPYPYSATDGREDANSTDNRVLRGGSWVYNARDARATDRVNYSPVDFLDLDGFRLALASAGS